MPNFSLNAEVKRLALSNPTARATSDTLPLPSRKRISARSIRCSLVCAAIDAPYTSLNAFLSVVGLMWNFRESSSIVTRSDI